MPSLALGLSIAKNKQVTDSGGGGGGPSGFTYLRPDGTSYFFRPDGTSYFIRP